MKSPLAFSLFEMAEASKLLESGGIVCIPTESSYGLAVDVACEKALARLVQIKEARGDSPFSMIASSLKMAKEWTEAWPSEAEVLAEQYWPGPLTLILRPSKTMAKELLGPNGGVAVRVSSNDKVRQLAAELGRPITATSANPSGKIPASTPIMARKYFREKVDLYVEDGHCIGMASTLVDFDAEGHCLVLRKGPIVLPCVS